MRKVLSLLLPLALLASPALAINDADIPTKIPTPWASSAPGGNVTCPIPIPSQISITAGRASWTDGFPPVTFLPGGAGGVPPFGQDFNGVLCQLSQWARWHNAGAPVPYDATFQSAVGGYPKGAIVSSATTFGLYWISLADANASNPDTGGANWASASFGQQVAAAVTGASTTLTNAQCNMDVPRSNGRALMTDTLPGTGTGVLASGCSIIVTNADSAALLQVSAGSGAALKGSSVNSLGTVILGPGQPATFLSDGSNYWVTSAQARTRLGANTTFYYSAAGNNANNGLASGSPWASATFAYSFLQKFFDLNAYAVTIQAAAGTYSAGENVNGPLTGQTDETAVTVQGNVSSQASYNYSLGSGGVFNVSGGARVTIQGFEMGTSLGSAVIAQNPGSVAAVQGITFAGVDTHNAHLFANSGGLIRLLGNYAITGGGGAHYKVGDFGQILVQATITVTITGSITFSGGFCEGYQIGVWDSQSNPVSFTGSGSVSATRYTSSLNSVIQTGGGGANFFPGTAGGTTSTGGQYQ